MTRIVAKRLATLLLAGAVVLGCSPDRGYVQREWSTTLRELGVVPVFPPREDVFVGDVYAYDFDPESSTTINILEKKYKDLTEGERALRQRLGMSPRLSRVNLNDLAAQQYKETPSWPETTSDEEQLLGPAEFQAISKLQGVQSDLISKKQDEVKQAEKDSKDATESKRLADIDVKLAQEQLTDAIAKRDSARTSLSDARKAFQEATTKLAGMDNQADRKKQQDVVDNLQKQVTDLEGTTKSAESDYAAAERALSDKQKSAADFAAAIKSADDKKTAANDAISKAKAELDSFKSIQEKLGAAGGKLTTEPEDPTYDVYTGAPLPKKVLSAACKPDPIGQAKDLVNSRENRLRLVAFPDFAATTFTEGELNALVPIEAFALGVRSNFSSLKSVSVKVPAAESYAVPFQDLRHRFIESATLTPPLLRCCLARAVEGVIRNDTDLHLDNGARGRLAKIFADTYTQSVDDWSARPTTPPTVEDVVAKVSKGWTAEKGVDALAGEMLKALADRCDRAVKPLFDQNIRATCLNKCLKAAADDQLAGPPASSSKYYYVRIITEVFYARALDVSLVSKSSFGARAELEAVAQAQASTGNAPSPISFQNPGVPAAVTKEPSLLTGSDLVGRTQAQLGERLKVPGGSVQLVSYSDSAIGMRRLFDRPVAIGFRGVTLEVERASGAISRVTVSSGSPPTLQAEGAKGPANK
jgi:hypothetical protein